MESIFWRMQDTAQQYVDILRDILGVDVSIIDANQVRIAGSGRMKERRGSMASYGNIVKHALVTKRFTVVEEALEHELCQGCPSRNHCDNLSEMWSPILLNGEAIGVIGCVSYTPEEREHFLAKREIFEQFFAQFAGLLESRALDLMEVERNQNVRAMLENVLGRAHIGILILDSHNKVYDINQVGKSLLQLSEDVHDYDSVILKALNSNSAKEYDISFEGRTHHIIADIYHISLEPYDRLILFNDADLRSDISDGLLGVSRSSDLERIIGKSQPIINLKKNIQTVAPSSSNVLITGESGTGKELVARAIHSESPRSKGPFVAINCAALPESLLESELFGYVKGAFTGANPQGKEGLFETAQGGTFFLDEVGDMPLTIQVKLLRVLEQREIMRVGSNTPIPIDVRFVFATNCNLEEMVSDGTFRKDLFYRINVVPIVLPPLRKRKGDIRLIANSFIQKFCDTLNKPCTKIGEDFWHVLEQYSWPGNIRELQNTMEYVVNMMPSSGVLHSELLSNKIHNEPDFQAEVIPPVEGADNWNLDQMESYLIKRCLQQHQHLKDGKRIAAQKLGIGMATLYRKIEKYGL